MVEPPTGRANYRPSARVVAGYIVLAIVSAAGIGIATVVGTAGSTAISVEGRYRLTAPDPCLGPADGHFELTQSGQFIVLGPDTGTGDPSFYLRLEGDVMSGEGRCVGAGHTDTLTFRVGGSAGTRSLVIEGSGVQAVQVEPEAAAKAPADKPSAEQVFARLMLAIAVVIIAARLGGSIVARLGQPRVMGEVLAGILLGPTLLGAVAPEIEHALFPAEVIPLLGAVANLGLAFYMFLVGLELDPRALKGRVEQAAFISNTSVAVPMALGFLAATVLHPLLAPVGKPFLPFALFIGVSMSITAFPVLARILVERRMLRRPVGVLALASAAVDDVTAWALLAVATAVAAVSTMPKDPAISLLTVLGLTILFCLVMGFGVRRILVRVSTAYDQAGHLSVGWISLIFIGVLLATAATGLIGIAPIFGAFVMGLAMPRREDLSHDVRGRMEDFIVIVLLPLFFVVAGLRADVGALGDPQLVALTVVIILVAIVAKLASAAIAARWTGLPPRESAAIGVLMNTRGLTELIVLNLGAEMKIISPALFTMLVIMALVTTFMTGPLLRLVDPRGILTASPRDELQEAAAAEVPSAVPRPERAVLAVALDPRHLDALTGIGAALTRTDPPRELIVVRLLEPGAITSGVSVLDRRIREANAELEARRQRLAAGGVPVRVAALTSSRPGRDLVRLAGGSDIDLVVVDGHRPVLGGGPLGGTVGRVLEDLPCDVAVLVSRADGPIDLGPDRPIVIPFGGAEHDWAALELGAGLAGATGAPLRLVGVTRRVDGHDDDPTRLLANASVVLQQITGVRATTQVVQPTEAGLASAAEDAGLVVAGLSERWRREGLGEARTMLARTSEAPVLFVRRGTRPGLLAPPDDLTRFAWSLPAGSPAGTTDDPV